MNKKLRLLIEDIWTESEYRFDKRKALDRVDQALKAIFSEYILTRLDIFLREHVFNSLFSTRIRKVIDDTFSDIVEQKLQTFLTDNFVSRAVETPGDLLKFLCQNYQIPLRVIKSRNKTKEVVRVRMIYCYLATKYWNYNTFNKQATLQTIGNEILRAHSEVLYLVKIFDKRALSNPDLKKEIENLQSKIVKC